MDCKYLDCFAGAYTIAAKNHALNRDLHSRVQIVNVALGSVDGQTLFTNRGDSMDHAVRPVLLYGRDIIWRRIGKEYPGLERIWVDPRNGTGAFRHGISELERMQLDTRSVAISTQLPGRETGFFLLLSDAFAPAQAFLSDMDTGHGRPVEELSVAT